MTSSPSSSSSSSQSAHGRPRPDHIQGMEGFQHLHLHSPPPPPPSPHLKHMKKHHHRHGHHGAHSPPPHHHRHFAHKPHHLSPPPSPICALYCKKDKLRVKHPKHCKKVRKLHHKLMKAYKPHKGTAHHHLHNVCPGAGQRCPSFNLADGPHHPGCCLYNRGLQGTMHSEMLAELDQYPPCHDARVVHHGHRHPHRHGRHGPHVRSEVRRGSAPPMSPKHEAKDMQAGPASEAGVPPPVPGNMLLADEGRPAVI